MRRMELLLRLDEALTYDQVAEKLLGCWDPSDPLDLGIVMHCVRKLYREAVKMTDEEYDQLIVLTRDRRWIDGQNSTS